MVQLVLTCVLYSGAPPPAAASQAESTCHTSLEALVQHKVQQHKSGECLVRVCARHTSVCARYTSVCARHTSVCARHTSVCAHYTSVCARHTSVCARHTSVCARHTSVCARYTSVCARYTSVCARHTSVCARHTSVCACSCQPVTPFCDIPLGVLCFRCAAQVASL